MMTTNDEPLTFEQGTYRMAYARALAALGRTTYHGDTLELDGRTYTVAIEPDNETSIMDDQGEGWWCGRIERGTRDRDTGYEARPEGFNGAARKLVTNRDGTIWWQPPADLINDPANLEALRSQIMANIEDGYSMINVEGPDGDDAGWLCGIDAETYGPEQSHWCDVVAEMVAQLHTAHIMRQFTMTDLERALSA